MLLFDNEAFCIENVSALVCDLAFRIEAVTQLNLVDDIWWRKGYAKFNKEIQSGGVVVTQ